MKHTNKPLVGLPHWFNAQDVAAEVDAFYSAVIGELKPLALDITASDAVITQLQERTKILNLKLLAWASPKIDQMGQRMHRIAKNKNRDITIAKVAHSRGRILDALIALVSIGLQRASIELAIDQNKLLITHD